LSTHLGKPLPNDGPFGESWEISPLAEQASVAIDPPWSGRTIADLWAAHPEWRGDRFRDQPEFPWLVKWLDCEERLSLQVHPDAETALRLCGVARPKNEAWVVIHAEPTARVWAGCRPGVTPEELQQRVQDGTFADCLHEFIPQPGDCISLPVGTLHAAGGGLLMAEVQQPSDLTFRMFDWNRVGLDGKPRDLHWDAACESLHWPQHPVQPTTPTPLPCSAPGVTGERLLSTSEFRFERWTIAQPWTDGSDRFVVSMVLDGRGQLRCGDHAQPVQAGDTLWFPALPRDATWEPDADAPLTLLQVTPPGR
jgi:mannose-6-phosphate isomerase